MFFAVDKKGIFAIIFTMEKKTKSSGIKANHLATNRNKVIQLIRQDQITDRNRISSALDINVSTSKRIVDDLLDERIVRMLGSSESTGGRKAAKIGINPDYGLNICVKIEVNSAIFALTDFLDNTIEQDRVPFAKGSSFEDVKPLIKQKILDFIVIANAKNKTIKGIGFAISGLTSKDAKKLVASRLLGWFNINFEKEFGTELKIPVFVEHDVNCAAIAEQWYGAGKDINTFVLVTVGEGTGSGIIINKKLYKGSYGGAGEIGHTIFEKNGIPCYCGQKGCLEMYTNEKFILDRIEKKHPEITALGQETIRSLLREDGENVKLILNEWASNLATGIIGAIALIEPERVIIGGELAYLFDETQSELKRVIDNNWINRTNDEDHQVSLVKSSLGPLSFIKGLSVLLVSRALYH